MKGDSIPYILGIVILVVAFLLFILILLSSRNTQVSCPAGQCPTNIVTGSKRCNDTTLRPLEVCNPQYSCTSSATPYALRGDGGINSDGTCDKNIECPCVGTPKCPKYIASIFNATVPEGTTGLSYTQSGTPGPISTSYCSLSTNALTLGPCNYFGSMTYDNLVTCASINSECDANIMSLPCDRGTLALITSNPDAVNENNYSQFPVGCLFIEKCPCGQLPIYDVRSNTRVCR